MRDDPAKHDQPRHQKGIGVAPLGAHEPRQSDRARRSGNVLDRRGARDAALLKHLLHHARGLIPAAARRCRRNDAQLFEHRLRTGRCHPDQHLERRQRQDSQHRTHSMRASAWTCPADVLAEAMPVTFTGHGDTKARKI
jgi:hypothetical protein